jgi:hypothetical protein
MQWRRGLLLAAIHLAVAGSMMVWVEAGYWRMLRADARSVQAAALRSVAWQDEQPASFNLCYDLVGGEVAPQEIIAGSANLPVALLTGWHQPCVTYQGVTETVGRALGGRTRTSEVWISLILCVLVFVQWLFVGGLPLVRPKRWWLEPGAFITLCTLVAIVPLLIPHNYGLVKAAMSLAALAWFWWFFLLVWKTLRVAWQLFRRSPAPARSTS